MTNKQSQQTANYNRLLFNGNLNSTNSIQQNNQFDFILIHNGNEFIADRKIVETNTLDRVPTRLRKIIYKFLWP